MVFGGIVHERLQLNEDTLWAGRPYDPVNPEAKAALPDVPSSARRTQCTRTPRSPQARRSCRSRWRRCRTRRSAIWRSPSQPVEAVDNYRRELDLETATTRVSYVSDGVTFSREIFASAPDQVIVVRLTASRPGCISVEARLGTPQRATVEATADGDVVMRGVNGDGVGATADGRPMTGCPTLRSAGPRPCRPAGRAAPVTVRSSFAMRMRSRC